MSMPDCRFLWSALWTYLLFMVALNLLVIGAVKIFFGELSDTSEIILGFIDFLICVPAAIESADFARAKKASQTLRYFPNVKLMIAAVCFYVALLMGAAIISALAFGKEPLVGGILIIICSFVAVPVSAAITIRWGRRPPDNSASNTVPENTSGNLRHEDSARRQKILDDYARVLEERAPGADFVDVSMLPHTKSDILDAILFEVVHQADSKFVELLTRGAEFLPQFQPKIGDRPLRGLNVTLAEIGAANQGSLDDKKELMCKVADYPDRERYIRVQEMARSELTAIRVKLAVATKIRAQVFAKNEL